MWEYQHTDTLYHYGIPGMKWGVRRYRKKDGSLTRAGRKRYGDDRHEDYKKAHDKKSVSLMSNQELRDRNNRLQAERQYKDLTRKTNIGKEVYKSFIGGAGMITAGVAAYKTYEKYLGPALKKLGGMGLSKITN